MSLCALKKKRKRVAAAPPSPKEQPVKTPIAPSVTDWAQKLVARLHGQIGPEEIAVLQVQTAVLGQEKGVSAVAVDPTRPVIVRDARVLAEVANKLFDSPELVVDLETSDLDAAKGEIVGIGLAAAAGTYYFPISHRFEENGDLRPNQMPLTQVLTALRLQDRNLIAHNAKFEWKWLRHHGGIMCQFCWDTMIAARLLRSDLPADLKTTAIRELDVPDWGLSKEEIGRVRFLPIEGVAAYCGKDCYYTLRLYERQKQCLV